MLNVARTLRDRGHRIVIWSVDQGDADVPSAVDGIPVRYLPCPLPARTAPAVARFARALPGAAARWWAAYRADRPDVLHVHCFGPNGVYASALGRLTRSPTVLSSHGETFMDAHASFESSALLRRALRTGLARATAVTTCSACTADDLVARYGLEAAQAVVVPNGVDEAEKGGPAPAWLPERYVFALGRLVQNKGFDLLLEAFAAADVPGVDLVIGGDGPERQRLQDQVERLGMAERVHLPGRLDRPDVVTISQRAAAFVVPSRIEAFGITVLEGWRAGVPVIATNRGGPAEFVTDGVTGLLVDPTDKTSLTAALERTLQDKEAAARMAAAGQRAVEAFTWDRVADAYEPLYPAAGRAPNGAAASDPDRPKAR